MSPSPPPPENAVSEAARLPEPKAEEGNLVIEHLWRFFGSLELTLANLAMLLLAVVFATFVNPASDPLADLEKTYASRPALLWAWRAFELYDPLRSWWFTLLLTSLALNLVACSLERLPRIWFLARYPEKRLDSVQGLRLRAQGPAGGNGPEQIGARLLARGYDLETLPAGPDGAVRLFAEKGRFARFGVWVVHLSLLLLLGGGVYGRLVSFEGVTSVPQNGGQTETVLVRRPDGQVMKKKLTDQDGRPFLLRCDDFRHQGLEPGRPKSLESDLKIFERRSDGSTGRLLAAQTISLNHPMHYAGLTISQTDPTPLDQQERAKITVTDKVAGQSHELVVGPAEPIDAADGLRYQLVDYNPDFNGQGPAVQVTRTELLPGQSFGQGGEAPAGAKTSSFWVFAKAPKFDADNREDRFAFAFEKLQSLYATGLQIARDPSMPVLYLGCLLLVAGLAISFSTSHKRLWVKLAGGTLELGGAAHRSGAAFGEQFDELCAELGLEPPGKKAPPATPPVTA